VEGLNKTVTVSKEAGGWYVCYFYAQVPTRHLPPTGRETSLNVGLKGSLIMAEGETVQNPRHHGTAKKQLAKAQKRLSCRKKGSRCRGKARKGAERRGNCWPRNTRKYSYSDSAASFTTKWRAS